MSMLQLLNPLGRMLLFCVLKGLLHAHFVLNLNENLFLCTDAENTHVLASLIKLVTLYLHAVFDIAESIRLRTQNILAQNLITSCQFKD